MGQLLARAIKALFQAIGGLALLGVAGTAPTRGAEPRVIVDWNLSPSDKVGSRKSGMACFPNGSLRWQEIAKPDPAKLAERLQSALRPISEEDQVRGKLVAIKASLCTPWLGVGEAEPKSTLKISMRWSFRTPSGVSTDEIIETELTRKRHDLRFDDALIADAVEVSLTKALSRKR